MPVELVVGRADLPYESPGVRSYIDENTPSKFSVAWRWQTPCLSRGIRYNNFFHQISENHAFFGATLRERRVRHRANYKLMSRCRLNAGLMHRCGLVRSANDFWEPQAQGA